MTLEKTLIALATAIPMFFFVRYLGCSSPYDYGFGVAVFLYALGKQK
ncbi:hypothetical protein [Candidatus Tokpelaia sp.]|nr:hypothetical protein [Candidatus Tokpelaia sp.]